MIFKIACIYLVILNVALFAVMGIDKFKAIKGAWRIPEKVLFAMAILGGSIGGILGMQVFRHKTLHLRFSIGFPAILLAQLTFLGWLSLELAG